jgi:hypothetical protein
MATNDRVKKMPMQGEKGVPGAAIDPAAIRREVVALSNGGCRDPIL